MDGWLALRLCVFNAAEVTLPFKDSEQTTTEWFGSPGIVEDELEVGTGIDIDQLFELVPGRTEVLDACTRPSEGLGA